MRKFGTKKWAALGLAATLVVTAIAPMGNVVKADAAKKVKATVKLNKTSSKLKVGDKVTLKVTKKNVKKIKSLTWKTKDKKVATVTKKGVVTAVATGQTKITCKVKFMAKGAKKYQTKTLSCKITVEKETIPSRYSENGLLLYPEIDMSDPSKGVKDAETVSSDAVVTDVTNRTDVHKSSNGVNSYDNGMMRKELKALQLVDFMGQGWNLINTLEACGSSATDVTGHETSWGQLKTTQSIIDGVKKSGFNSVRIPVAWSNMISDDGTWTIDDAYLKRVEEVINYCLKNEMYAVVNIHYDGGWWGMFGAHDQATREAAWKKYESIWTQIANRYKEYSDRLIFESANEELGSGVNEGNKGFNTAVNGVVGCLTEDELYAVTNAVNQKFVEIVRKSGGNNTYRQLLIAGYKTDIDATCDERFVMPTDTVKANGKEKLSVSIHFYAPGGYCIGEDATVDWYLDSWGTEQDYVDMHAGLDKMKKFTKEGHGVIIGEYGPQSMAKKGVVEFIKEVMIYGHANGMAPMIWNGSIYDRDQKVIVYADIAAMLAEVTGAKEIPVEEGADNTGAPAYEIMKEEDVVKVAQWDGTWTRTNGLSSKEQGNADGYAEAVKGDGELGKFETAKMDGGIQMHTNTFWWQLFASYDWSSLKKPCIRITMAEDELSKEAEIELGYAKVTESYNEKKGYTQFKETCGKADKFKNDGSIVSLSTNKLTVRPWLWMSTPTQGASIVKVEIFDVK